MTVLLVALGAAVGAPLRFLTDWAMQARYGHRFPWGTLTVNVAGSLVLGFVVGLPAAPGVAALVGTGFCGALTTYSSFAVQTHERGARLGTVNVLVTVVPALLLCFAGFALGG